MLKKLLAVLLALTIGFNSTLMVHAEDVTPPLVSGVEESGIYSTPVTISYDEGDATLNDVAIGNPQFVSEMGTYVLVVSDASNNVTTVHFTITDTTAPIISGVENHKAFLSPVTIGFNEGTALLDGTTIANDTLVSELGVHHLVVTDLAGNQTTIDFNIVSRSNIPYLYEVTTTETPSITLSWTAVDGAAGYYVYSWDDTHQFWSSMAYVSNRTSFTTVNISFSKTYLFKVKSIFDGTQSDDSNIVEVKTVADPDFGKVVTGLTAVTSNLTDITLNWTAADYAKSYAIYHQLDGTSNWVFVKSTDATTLLVEDLSFDEMYHFKVNVILQDDTEYTKPVYITKWTDAAPVPVVTGINSTIVNNTGANITWIPVQGATSYHIVLNGYYRGTKIEATTYQTSYTFATIRNDEYYNVLVSAIMPFGNQFGEGKAGRGFKTVYLMVKPTGVRMINQGFNFMTIGWDQHPLLGNSTMEVCISTSSATSGFSCMISFDSFVYKSTTTGVTYWVKIRGQSSPDGITTWTPYSDVVALKPTLPAPVVAVSLGGYDRVTLSWSKIDGALGYQIYQSTSLTGTNTLLTTTTSLNYLKTGLTTNTTYYYKVRAYLKSGVTQYYSPYSTIVSAKPLPSTPVGVTAVSAGFDRIKFSWAPVSGATGYEVSFLKTGQGSYVLLPLQSATSALITGLSINTLTSAKVRAYRLVGTVKVFGNYSSIVSATTIPATPVLTVVSDNYNRLKISWSGVAGANGYELYHLNTSTGLYELLADGAVIGYIHENLVSGVNHSYKLKAYTIVKNEKIYSTESQIVTSRPIPNTPSGIKSVSTNYNTITTRFGAVDGVTGYEIYRSTTHTGTYTLVLTTVGLTYANSALAFNTTYYFKVRAFTLVGSVKIFGNFTTIVSAKTYINTPIVSGASLSYNSNRISWQSVAGSTAYQVYRSTSINGTYTLLNTTTATSYINSSLTPYGAYYYKVRAYRTIGTLKYYSGYSAVLLIRPVPAVPTNVVLISTGYESVKTSWSAVLGASGYEVHASSSSTGAFILKTSSSSLSSTISGLRTNVPIYVKARAYRLIGTVKAYGAFSAVVNVTPIPATPVLSLTSLNYASMKLSWLAVTGASGYEIYHLEGNSRVLVQNSSGLVYTATGLVTGDLQTYKVIAYRLVDSLKVYGKEATVSGKAIPQTPIVSGIISYNSIQLSWPAVEGVEGFEIFRSTSVTGIYTLVSAIDRAPVYIDYGLNFNTTYFYKIRAYSVVNNVKIDGNFSVVYTAKTIPSTPIINVTSSSYSSLQISWSAIDGANGYQIYRSTSISGVYSLLTSTSALTYNNVGLLTNTSYYYKVRAYRIASGVNIYGNFSSIVYNRPIPSIASNAIVNALSVTSLKVSWNAVLGATGYEVYRSLVDGGTFTLMNTTTTTSYVNSGLLTNVPYFYKVRAYRLVGLVKVYGNYTSVMNGRPLPPTPIGVTFTLVSSGTVRICKNDPTYNGSQYEGTVLLVKDLATGLFVESNADFSTTLCIDVSRLPGQSITAAVQSYSTFNQQRLYSTMSTPQIFTFAMPAAPSSFHIETMNALSANFVFDAYKFENISYEIWKSTTATGVYSLARSVNPWTFSAIVTGLNFNTTYFFKIRTVYKSGTSTISVGSFSAPISGKTVMNTPSIVSIAAISWDQIELVFNRSGDADWCQIYVSDSMTGSFYNRITTTGGHVHDTGITELTTKYYKVRCLVYVNYVAQYSSFSPIVSATTGVKPSFDFTVTTSYSVVDGLDLNFTNSGNKPMTILNSPAGGIYIPSANLIAALQPYDSESASYFVNGQVIAENSTESVHLKASNEFDWNTTDDLIFYILYDGFIYMVIYDTLTSKISFYK